LFVIRNAAGEEERDRLSPRANLIEAGVVFAVAFAAWWTRTDVVLYAAVAYVFVGARFLHQDGAVAWGLPPLGAAPRRFRAAGKPGRPLLLALAAGLLVAVVALSYAAWPYVLLRTGVRLHAPETYARLAQSALARVAFGVLVWLAVVFLLVRWERPRAGLWRVVVCLFGLVLVVAAFVGDWSGFRWFGDAQHAFLPRAFFYVLWALLQHYVLLGFLNGRLRKGLGGVRGGRVWTALGTGAVFGALHLPHASLVAYTFGVGALFGWLFQRERTRDLFALAVAHGIAGTLYTLVLPWPTAVGPG